uniref:Uncharacterized protein n=1 Tax=Anopheles melas TaxID=34690 RepID=A0A182TK68_9DIPT
MGRQQIVHQVVLGGVVTVNHLLSRTAFDKLLEQNGLLVEVVAFFLGRNGDWRHDDTFRGCNRSIWYRSICRSRATHSSHSKICSTSFCWRHSSSESQLPSAYSQVRLRLARSTISTSFTPGKRVCCSISATYTISAPGMALSFSTAVGIQGCVWADDSRYSVWEATSRKRAVLRLGTRHVVRGVTNIAARLARIRMAEKLGPLRTEHFRRVRMVTVPTNRIHARFRIVRQRIAMHHVVVAGEPGQLTEHRLVHGKDADRGRLRERRMVRPADVLPVGGHVQRVVDVIEGTGRSHVVAALTMIE